MRNALTVEFQTDRAPRLHWVDNYAKCYASTSMFSNRALYKSCLWTAHGMKRLHAGFDASWVRDHKGTSVPALPDLDVLLSQQHFDDLLVDLFGLGRNFYERSLVVGSRVRRIPVKVPDGKTTEDSADGLKHFVPVDLYSTNIASTEGLLRVLHRLQQLEGFGDLLHSRSGLYSFVCVDVKIFWLWLRLLYSYPAFVGKFVPSY